MKRFYKTVAVEAKDEGLAITLDGRPVRTPGKALLLVPRRPLAEAIAGEWEAQGEEVRPTEMPLTAIACTAIDLVAHDRAAAREELLSFAEHELLCYRAEEPDELVARQEQVWRPLLDWLEATHGARLAVGSGLLELQQPAEALAALRGVLERYDALALTGLATAVRACGSLVVGLALAEQWLSAAEAFAASELEETFQIERWGEDPIAAERRDGIRRDLEAAARFFQSLQT